MYGSGNRKRRATMWGDVAAIGGSDSKWYYTGAPYYELRQIANVDQAATFTFLVSKDATTKAAGSGDRMYYDCTNGSFRAGGTAYLSTMWDFRGYYSVAMGYENTAGGESSISLGAYNHSDGRRSVAMGDNCRSNDDGSVAMGTNSIADHAYTTISGGVDSVASAQYSTISGGDTNNTSGSWSTIGGGSHNVASGNTGTVGGGAYNRAVGQLATVSGGFSNEANSYLGTVGGGESNIIAETGTHSTIAGGHSNTAPGVKAYVGGGSTNSAGGIGATVGGGLLNLALATHSTIGGGNDNIISSGATYSTIGGGFDHDITGSSPHSTISGGRNNHCGANYSTIGGGLDNSANGEEATIAGGSACTAPGTYSSVIGGNLANAGGAYSAVVGGYLSKADGDYSLAGGKDIQANAEGSIAWGSSHRVDTAAKYSTIVGGIDGQAANQGQCVYATGKFNTRGDSQFSKYIMRRRTASTAAVTMYLNYPTNTLEIPTVADFGYWITIRLVGVRLAAAGGNKTQAYTITYAANANSATSNFDAQSQWYEHTPNTAPALLNYCDCIPTASKLRITVAPLVADVIHWTCLVEVIECKGAA